MHVYFFVLSSDNFGFFSFSLRFPYGVVGAAHRGCLQRCSFTLGSFPPHTHAGEQYKYLFVFLFLVDATRAN